MRIVERQVDLETRRKKRQALMVQMVERKVRSRAQQLYEDRGEVDGQDLQDWFQAESEVLEDKIIGPLYRRIRIQDIQDQDNDQQKAAQAQLSDPTTE